LGTCPNLIYEASITDTKIRQTSQEKKAADFYSLFFAFPMQKFMANMRNLNLSINAKDYIP
jgi:hypothetical protein